MTEQPIHFVNKTDALYQDMFEWDVNAGGEKIVAKRQPGRFRRLKWFSMSVWLIYFLMPYMRWDGKQAILFDIPNRQFSFFSINIFPQDIWMLSLLLLFFAILLAAVTSIAGRVFCGYFCFQTVWTDIYTLIETWLEGNSPQKQKKFHDAPWSFSKLSRVVSKHFLWLLIAVLTGFTFSAWFTDVYGLWRDVLTLEAHTAVWLIMAVFTTFTYVFAGFMREQVCFWLCPYARLQGVMYDQNTVVPAYDADRGEPRGRLNKSKPDADKGDCIDCNLCVAVCPTGVDIRKGQQEGCITCGLCIDACDSVMDKIDRPRGLIRYASHAELVEGETPQPIYKRPRVVIYSLILLTALAGVAYGFTTLSSAELTVSKIRKPQFVMLSNGDIQNRYQVKLLNKENDAIEVQYRIAGLEGAVLEGAKPSYSVAAGEVLPLNILVKSSSDGVSPGSNTFEFIAEVHEGDGTQEILRQKAIFSAPSQP